MFKHQIKHVKNFTLSIATATVFFSCSEGVVERDSGEAGLTSVNKASYKMAAAVPVQMNSWMAGLQDNISLSKISIPGTHDSGARIDAPVVSGTAKTQDLSIAEQLNAGVRFLDIRCRHIDNSFTIIMGLFIRI
ncbi:hypothetical protein [Chryseobacterium sp. CH1]|uniref:hypothetical protein n=1 Tax=Chryseobacterium sp. CH1 TaxID=713551 RepID=UPI001E4A5621|nr:hypothetical protein [Chryseobacterium sp. CH1]